MSAEAQDIPALIAQPESVTRFDYHQRRVDLMRTVHHYRERLGILDATWAHARGHAEAELREATDALAEFELRHRSKPWGQP